MSFSVAANKRVNPFRISSTIVRIHQATILILGGFLVLPPQNDSSLVALVHSDVEHFVAVGIERQTKCAAVRIKVFGDGFEIDDGNDFQRSVLKNTILPIS